MSKENQELGRLCFSTNVHKAVVVAQIGDNIKVLVVQEKSKVKLIIEAPKSTPIQRLREIEEAIINAQG